MTITIEHDGTARTIYSETLDLESMGTVTIARASHVEPNEDGQWFAQMVGGPVLGPFAKRSAALAAEVAWLESNVL
ncbi:MAG: hypothetical protein ABSG53_10535 [Thermoguttaceae bacterium]|jgi:hypothetical protein